jgi:kynurenine formamidase
VPTRLVDLTLTLKDGLSTWDGKPPFTLLPYMNAATFKLGFSTKLLVMEDHTGTHVDASLHFYDGARRTPRGRSIAELPLEKLHGDAVCIDLSAKRGDEPVTAEMLAAAAEKQRVEVRSGDIVLIRIWSGTWGGDAFFAARGLTKDACEWLLERGAKCVGVDHPNLEGRVSEELGNAECPGHVLLLHPEREIPIIENLVGLKGLRGKRFRFFGLPLKMDGATGSPIRAVALLDD